MSSLLDEDKINTVHPRKPIVAALLSFVPGVGQVYNGQFAKGMIFLLIEVLIPVLFGVTGVLLTLNGLIAIIIVVLIFGVYRVVDGFVVARRLKDYELKSFNKVYFYLIFALVVVATKMVVNIQTTAGIQAYRIGTPSMAPNLMVGDRAIFHLFEHKETAINYGDIVAYNKPENGVWISRVIALPSDSIEIVDGIVFVNGKRNEIAKVKEYVLDQFDVIEYKEQLANSDTISTLRFKEVIYPEGRNKSSQLVPEDEYYIVSDNRDDALDSRYFGPIKKADLVGKFVYVFWSSSDK